MIRHTKTWRRFLVKCLAAIGVVVGTAIFVGPIMMEWARGRLGDLAVVRMWFGGGGLQVHSIAFSPDGQKLAVGYSFPSLTCTWDVRSRSQLMIIKENEDEAIKHVSYSPDGKLLAVGIEKLSDVGTAGLCVKIRDADTGKLTREFEMPALAVFSPDGDMLATGDAIRTMPEGTVLRRLTTPAKFWMTGLDFSRDGRLLAASGFIGGGLHPRTIALVWEVKTGQTLKLLKCPEREPHETCAEGKSIHFHPDGKHVAIGTMDDAFYIWNIETDAVNVIRREGGRWWAVKYSPDGQLVAASGAGGIVFIWDMNGNKELCALKSHVGSVYAVEFSPSGDVLATGGMDGMVRLWGITGHFRKGWGLTGELGLGSDAVVQGRQ